MTHTDLERALAKLREKRSTEVHTYYLGGMVGVRLIGPELAALIEAAASIDDTGDWCHICGSFEHKPQCPLVALVRAINGEQS